MWEVTYNSTIQKFEEFKSAVDFYRGVIIKFITNNKDGFGAGAVPFQISTYFSYKYDESIISENELAIEEIMNKLFATLLNENWLEAQEKASEVISNDLSYSGEYEEFNEEVSIELTKGSNQIVANLDYDDGDHIYLKTNSFIFKNDSLDYYFDSHQIINTSSDYKNLGRIFKLNIRLTKCNQ